jgi:predicted enzyme related to lactoylglutathione lyase
MDARIGYINIHVQDFDRAIPFYRDVLGFELLFSDQGFHYARFKVGDLTLAVASGHGDEFTGHGAGDKLTGVGFVVKDVDAVARDLKSKGVRFTLEPGRQPWGGYMGMFADPEGNVFYLDTAE